MSNIDQEFIEYVVKSLVGNPDAVSIERRIDEKGVLLELTVDPEDLGRVIGKRGATAQSLRTLLRALGTKNEARYNLKIIDNGVGEHAKNPDDPRTRTPGGDQPAPASDAPQNDNQHDDNQQQGSDTPAPADEPVAVVEESPVSPAPEATPEAEASDRLAQTRAELNDLDDLDI